MTRLHQWLADRKARKAAQYLVQCRIKRERKTIHQVAQQMRIECGLLPHRCFK